MLQPGHQPRATLRAAFSHFDQILLFGATQVPLQVREHRRILADHHQPVVVGRQRGGQLQAVEVPLQRTDVTGIQLAAGLGADQRAQGVGRYACRFVQQHAGALGLAVAGLLGHHDAGALVHRALRLFHHLAIDADPAALDIAPRFTTRDAEQGGQAFVESGRFHGERSGRGRAV
ncbi:hypothetical protein D3C72_1171590 [compost metagenome]